MKIGEEKGVALILGMLLLLVATLIGINALNTSMVDVLIAGNERTSVQAFYVAEAGIHEFMGRFREGATHEIVDSDPTNPNWKVLLASYPGKGATQIGYSSANPNSYLSLQTKLDYGVEIKHKIDSMNQVVTYGGAPIYILRSFGFTRDGGNKALEVEIRKSSGYDPPAAIYSERPISIQGNSTYINGYNGCASIHHKPGVMTPTTTLPPIIELDNPPIDGSPPKMTRMNYPLLPILPIKEMIDYIKGDANFKYSYSENHTLTGYSNSWGMPISHDSNLPITYSGPMNIIYFNMNGDKTLTLAGGSHGAGLLLVEGNLVVNGDFTWYGVILTTGSVVITGSGEKNLTGGLLSGGTASVTAGSGGDLGFIYCSGVSNHLKSIVPPLKMNRWREIF